MKKKPDIHRFSLPESCRSYSSKNFTRTFYKPLHSRQYNQESITEETPLQNGRRKPTVDYLLLLSPKKKQLSN